MFEYAHKLDAMLEGTSIPKVCRVSQAFSEVCDDNPVKTLLASLHDKFPQEFGGKRIAVPCGSRGIDMYLEMLRAIVGFFREKGAAPVLVPAMGSHGGATAEGQRELLSHLGITAESAGAEIHSSMDVVEIARTNRGMPVYIDRFAFESDGIFLFNRIKPHTSFRGTYESGLVKMLVIGLGKQKGAEATHSLRFANMAKNVEDAARILLDKLPVLGGVGTVENGYGRIAEVAVLTKHELLPCEPALLSKAFSLMPRIYLDEIDVLIVKEIGKDVSGTGMDTNIVGRFHTDSAFGGPNVIKLGVLDLTENSGGNANGVGLADFTTERLYRKIDFGATYMNTLTTGEPKSSTIPMILSCDRSVVRACLKLCGVQNSEDTRMVIIKNTKNIGSIFMSKAAFEANCSGGRLAKTGDFSELKFDADGNLAGLFQDWGELLKGDML